jgi:hypothetical protein
LVELAADGERGIQKYGVNHLEFEKNVFIAMRFRPGKQFLEIHEAVLAVCRPAVNATPLTTGFAARDMVPGVVPPTAVTVRKLEPGWPTV